MNDDELQITTVDDALIFLDYMGKFIKAPSARYCAQIADVIRSLVCEEDDEPQPEYLYLGSPTDVVTALMQRAWDDSVGDDDRILMEAAAKALESSLDRNVKLASVIEKTEGGL